MKRKIYCAFLCICFLCITEVCHATYLTIPTWAEDSIVETSGEVGENFLDLSCESAILISQDTGEVLYEHNAHEKLRPASVTKVMTILLIMEEIDSGRLSYYDKISCSEKASSMGGSQIWLDTREELTVDEMLKAICVVSANDCTVAMAEHIAGSEEMFVNRMNERAKELGMNDTTFKNCHGIDEDGHETSSYDIALMSRELLRNHPSITKYTTIGMDSLRDGKSELVNTNKLIRNYQGATGLKTGSTSLALFNLSASATRDDLSLIAVIMRAPSTKERFSCARKLLDYGFSTFKYKKFAEKDVEVMNVPINKGVVSEVSVKYADTSGKIMNKKSEGNIEQEIIINDNVSAPIEAGQVLGRVEFKVDGEAVASVELVAENDVAKLNIFTMGKRILKKWFYLFRK
jgi:D-alanyl-D-alanine carboxypeptidase (penicillin-binding protein 5/6)